MRLDLIKALPFVFAMLPGCIVSVPAHTGMYHVSFVVHLPQFMTTLELVYCASVKVDFSTDGFRLWLCGLPSF